VTAGRGPRVAAHGHAAAMLAAAGGHAVSWLASARGHPRHLVLFALAAGLGLGPVSPAATMIAVCVVAALAGRRPLALLAASAVLAGAAFADGRLAALDAGSLRAMHGRHWEGSAVLLEPVREHGAHASARVRLNGLGEQAVARLRVPGAGPPGAPTARHRWPEVGEVVALSGRIAPLDKFDSFQARRGAHAALDVERLRRTGAWRGGVAGALDGVRRRAEVGLARGLPGKEAALLRGMVLGQDERLSEAVRTDFQRSGLAHLLAVSGQNVVLLAMLALAAGMVAGIGLRARLVVALALVVVYVPLAGGGPSIQRAGVMGGAGLVAALAGRPASRWYAVGLAAAATLALNPRVSGEPGWQLSFAAVVGLLVLVPRWREGLRRARLPGPVADAVAVTAAATVATAPLMALHFEQVSLASLPANLAAAAAVAPIMWLGMVAIAVAQVSPVLCGPLNALNGPLLAYLEWIAHVAAQPPAAALPVRLGGSAGLALTYAAGAAVIVLAGRGWRWAAAKSARAGPRRRGRGAVAGAVAGLAALGVAPSLGSPHAPQPGEFVISFLNIGQGDATLLQHGGASILVDTGPPGGPILRRLREAGVRRLDALVLTHAQLDHEGMGVEVARAFHPRLVLDGGAGWDTPTQRGLPRGTVPAHAGQAIALGGIRLKLLWPPRPPPGWRPEGDPNNRAVVAIASVASFDVLLTADAESDVTGPLQLPPVEAMKVAHHGSEDPGLPALLARTRPAFAGIEVGKGNTYGHPTAPTLAELHAAVPHVYRTDRDGTVRLHVTAAGVRIEHAP
jgi:competence protein ComEC